MARHLLKSAIVGCCVRVQSRQNNTLGLMLFSKSSHRCLNTVLEHKVALVTGSRRGIGLSIADALAQRGCNVILNGTTDDELAAAAKTRLLR